MARLPFAIAFGCAIASSAISGTTYQTATTTTETFAGITVAQAGIAGLSDSDLRRINFYSERCMNSVLALGSDPGETELMTVRNDISRLVDAGARSGLSLEDTADYFQLYVAENGLEKVPGYLLEPSGQLETRVLFSAVEEYLARLAPLVVDVDAINNSDLLAIQSAATVNQNTAIAPQPVVADAVQIALPEIPNASNPITRSILERVQLRGNECIIEVAPLDD